MSCLTPKPITNEHDGHLQGWKDCGRCRYCLSKLKSERMDSEPCAEGTGGLNEPTRLGEALVATVNDPEVKAAMESEKP